MPSPEIIRRRDSNKKGGKGPSEVGRGPTVKAHPGVEKSGGP